MSKPDQDDGSPQRTVLSVSVSQPAFPLRVAMVLVGRDGGFTDVQFKCVGIETSLIRDCEGFTYTVSQAMFVDPHLGIVTHDDEQWFRGDGHPYHYVAPTCFVTFDNDPYFDSKLAQSKELLRYRRAALDRERGEGAAT